jgi:hypothetical protein
MKNLKALGVGLGIIAITCLVIKLYWYFILLTFPNPENNTVELSKAGSFGDMFGMLNSVLSILSISILAYSLIHQMKINNATINALNKQLQSQEENKTFSTAQVLITELNSYLENLMTGEGKTKAEYLRGELLIFAYGTEITMQTSHHKPILGQKLNDLKKILHHLNPRISVIKNLLDHHSISNLDHQMIRSIASLHFTDGISDELKGAINTYNGFNNQNSNLEPFDFSVLTEFQSLLDWINQKKQS